VQSKAEFWKIDWVQSFRELAGWSRVTLQPCKPVADFVPRGLDEATADEMNMASELDAFIPE